MKLIILRVPKKTTPTDVKRFVREGIRTRIPIPFTNQPRVVSAEVVVIRDDRGRADYHGMVTVLPDSSARRLIRKLNGMDLNGKKVMVREFRKRSRNGYVFDPLEDRRRPNLTVEKSWAPSVEGLEQFARDYSV